MKNAKIFENISIFILHRQNEKWHGIDSNRWVTERKCNEQNFAEMQEKFFVERA